MKTNVPLELLHSRIFKVNLNLYVYPNIIAKYDPMILPTKPIWIF